MATKTPKYELQKKEDNDFYNIEDLNANWDKVENALTEFDDSGTAEGITSFTDMLAKLVTGDKLAVTLRNLKAGLQFVLHTGSIVNNCVTDNAKLPLSAAQGKVLQDAITKLNGDFRLSRSECSKNTESNVEMEICQYRATKDIIVSLAGWYTTPGNSTGVRRVNIYAYNMSCFLSGTPAGQNLVGFSGVFFLKSGETIGIRVNQTSGSTLSSKIFIHSNVAFS